jgi:hypothetical protein
MECAATMLVEWRGSELREINNAAGELFEEKRGGEIWSAHG